MLSAMREKSKGPVAKIILGLLALTFILIFGGGLDQVGSGRSSFDGAAQINGEKVPLELLKQQEARTYSNYIAAYQEQLNKLKPKQRLEQESALQRQSRMSALGQLTDSFLKAQLMQNLGLATSNAELIDIIFKAGGAEDFDIKEYKKNKANIDANYGMNVEDYFRKMALAEKFDSTLAAHQISSKKLAEQLASSRSQFEVKIVQVKKKESKISPELEKEIIKKIQNLKKEDKWLKDKELQLVQIEKASLNNLSRRYEQDIIPAFQCALKSTPQACNQVKQLKEKDSIVWLKVLSSSNKAKKPGTPNSIDGIDTIDALVKQQASALDRQHKQELQRWIEQKNELEINPELISQK